jgi:GntR family transcriptional regulator
MLERRRESGTFLVRPPGGARLQSGLEKLESYTIHAERLGLKLDSEDLNIEAVCAELGEAAALDVPEGSPLVKVSRVLLIERKPAAWMVDVVPASVLGTEEIRERFRPDAMLLDLLVSEGVAVGFSQMFIEAAMLGPDDPVGGKLRLKEPLAALLLIQTMYLGDGRPVQWSRDTFLPGNLNLHVARELFEIRRLT